jgi:hypothetical protein
MSKRERVYIQHGTDIKARDSVIETRKHRNVFINVPLLLSLPHSSIVMMENVIFIYETL